MASDLTPAGMAGRAAVPGYDPKKHDPFFDGVSDALADSVVDLIKDANGNHVRRGYRLDLIALLSR